MSISGARRRGFGFLVAIAVAALPALAQPLAAGATPTGTLFAITASQNLVTINTGTGAFTAVGSGLNTPDSPQSTALAIDPATHRLFALRTTMTGVDFPPTVTQELLTIDSQSGVILSKPQFSTIAPQSLAFDTASGVLFGFTGLDIVRVDPATATTSLVAPIATTFGPFIYSLALDTQTHTIYLAEEDVSGSVETNTTQIFSVSTAGGPVSTGHVLDKAVRQIAVDSGHLFGVTECCPADFVAINNSTGATTFLAGVGDPGSMIQFGTATDTVSHTVFIEFGIQDPFTFISTFFVESINDQSGAFAVSPALPDGVATLGLAFEPGTAPLDTSPPATSIVLTPGPNGAGWNNTSVAVNLSATDPDGTTDVASVHYSATGAQPIAATVAAGSAASFTLTAEGITTITYFAIDQAGNAEAAHTQVVRIDTTQPTVTYAGNAGTYTVDQTVAITCTAFDPSNANGTPGSGLASSTCANVNAPAYSFPLGTNTLSASATDVAGNVGSGSTTFTVQVTYSSLCSLTRRFIQSSPAFQTSPALGRAQGDRLCKILAAAGSAPGPAKKALIVSYQKGLTLPVNLGLLTPAQAAILLTLSKAL